MSGGAGMQDARHATRVDGCRASSNRTTHSGQGLRRQSPNRVRNLQCGPWFGWDARADEGVGGICACTRKSIRFQVARDVNRAPGIERRASTKAQVLARQNKIEPVSGPGYNPRFQSASQRDRVRPSMPMRMQQAQGVLPVRSCQCALCAPFEERSRRRMQTPISTRRGHRGESRSRHRSARSQE